MATTIAEIAEAMQAGLGNEANRRSLAFVMPVLCQINRLAHSALDHPGQSLGHA